jgi:hypothetical protein
MQTPTPDVRTVGGGIIGTLQSIQSFKPSERSSHTVQHFEPSERTFYLDGEKVSAEVAENWVENLIQITVEGPACFGHIRPDQAQDEAARIRHVLGK